LHIGSSDGLARIPSSTRRTSPASPRTKLVKEQQAPVLPLSQELIAKTVQGQLPRIRACYERVIKHEPTARGRILLSWTIRADGGVERVEVVEDEVGSEQFRGCAARSVAKWRFPVGAQSVAVSYPFHMTSRSY
jgi:hypothetical protein